MPLELAGDADALARARPRSSPRSASPSARTTTPSSSPGGEQQRVAVARAMARRPRAAPRRRAHGQPRLGHRQADHRAARRACATRSPARSCSSPTTPRWRPARTASSTLRDGRVVSDEAATAAAMSPARSRGVRGRTALVMAWRETRGAGRHFVYFVACVTRRRGGASSPWAASRASMERTVGARRGRSWAATWRSARAARCRPSAATRVAGLARERRRRHARPRARGDGAGGPDADAAHAARRAQGGRARLSVLRRGSSPTPIARCPTLIGGGRALVQEALLARLGLPRRRPRARSATRSSTLSGLIVQEPDRAVGVFSLGPRMLIAAEDLDRTGLVRAGSRVRHRTLFRLPDGRDARGVQDRSPRRGARRRRPHHDLRAGAARPPPILGSAHDVPRASTGLVALMVGGIGVAVSVRAFVRQKLAHDRDPQVPRRAVAGRSSPIYLRADRAPRPRRQRARARSSAARSSR